MGNGGSRDWEQNQQRLNRQWDQTRAAATAEGEQAKLPFLNTGTSPCRGVALFYKIGMCSDGVFRRLQPLWLPSTDPEGAQGARAPPEKSQLTLLVFISGQFFGQIPQISARRLPLRLISCLHFLAEYGKFSRLALLAREGWCAVGFQQM